jgi:hypothetical protein
MPVLIVGSERNLSQLKSRLFQGRVSRARLATVTDAVARANPGVDLDRLEPGTVLTIPELPEVDLDAGLSVDPVTKQAVAEAARLYGEALEAAAAEDTARRDEARTERASVAKALEAASGAAGRGDKELAAAIKAARAALDADEERDKEDRALARKAVRSWASDLNAMRAMVKG